MNLHSIHKNKDGYITLLSILIVGAVTVAITLSLIFSGLSAARNGFAYQQMHQAKALASACIEEGLNQIRSSTAFTGVGSLTFTIGTCTYTVTNQGGENRTINGVGTVGTIVRKITTMISTINPLITVSTWQEI